MLLSSLDMELLNLSVEQSMVAGYHYIKNM